MKSKKKTLSVKYDLGGAVQGAQMGMKVGGMFGPLGMGIGALAGGIGGHFLGDYRNAQAEQEAKNQAPSNYNSNPYGTITMEDGGLTLNNPLINIELGELMVDRNTGDVVEDYSKERGFKPHSKTKEDTRNFVPAVENGVVIPKKYAQTYRENTKLRQGILRDVINKQADRELYGVDADGNKVEYSQIEKDYQKMEFGGDPELEAMSQALTQRNSNLPWVARVLNNSDLKINNKDGTHSTHRLAYSTDDKGGAMVYPTIIERDGALVQLGDDEAYNYAMKNKTGMQVPNVKLAEYYSKNGLIKHKNGGFANKYNYGGFAKKYNLGGPTKKGGFYDPMDTYMQGTSLDNLVTMNPISYGGQLIPPYPTNLAQAGILDFSGVDYKGSTMPRDNSISNNFDNRLLNPNTIVASDYVGSTMPKDPTMDNANVITGLKNTNTNPYTNYNLNSEMQQITGMDPVSNMDSSSNVSNVNEGINPDTDLWTVGNTLGAIGTGISALGPLAVTLANGIDRNENNYFSGVSTRAEGNVADMFRGVERRGVRDLALRDNMSQNLNRNRSTNFSSMLSNSQNINRGTQRNMADFFNQVGAQRAQIMADLNFRGDMANAQGLTARDERLDQNRDNFYSNLANNISNAGVNVQGFGRNLNQNTKNQTQLQILRQISPFYDIDANGNITFKG